MDGAERIFINYRRADTRWAASRLYDGLSQRFGANALFMDVDSIPPGADFVDYLNAYVDRSQAIVVLIGPNWLSLCDETGRRRIEDRDDFVNIEIRRALEKDTTVIPVLIDGAEMPSETDLPNDLRRLARRQAVTLGHETYGQDLDRLARALGAVATPPATANKSRSSLSTRLGWSVLSMFLATAFMATMLYSEPTNGSKPPAQSSIEHQIAGNWSSDYGDMVWTNAGASYGGGRVAGSFHGRDFKGHWFNEASKQPCTTSRDGSHAWGTVWFNFDASLHFFQGHWGYCDAQPDQPWSGTRAQAAQKTSINLKANASRPRHEQSE